MMIDMHSHILPGLDDGAADWEQAIAMARVAVEDGITEMTCTPHWVLGKYENGRMSVLKRFVEFQERLAEEKIPLKIHSGAELRIDMSILERVKSGELLTLNDGSGYLLLELPEEIIPANLSDFFWNLQLNGFRPILSHVERNAVLRDNPERLFRWVEAGILAQITAASLIGEGLEGISDFSRMLVEHRMVHMLVTDTHSLRRRKPELSKACRVIEEILGSEAAARMVCDTPQHVLRGEAVPVVDPIPLNEQRKKGGFWSFFGNRGSSLKI